MKLNVKAFALSTGAILGLSFLVLTFLFLILSYDGFTLAKLHKVLFGFRVVWWGAFIGLFWGFVYGSIGGGIFAWIYNKLINPS